MRREIAVGACLWALACALACGRYEMASGEADAGPGPFVGSVTFTWSPASASVTAAFTTPAYAGELGSTPGNCPGLLQGSCCTWSQPQVDRGAGATAPPSVSAGSIALTTGSQDIGQLEFASGFYAPLSSAELPALTWAPGDELLAFGAGGGVPSFTGAVAAPPALGGVSPDLELSTQIVVHLADDFTVSWTPLDTDGGSSVDVELFDPAGFYADCSAPDASGTIDVPAGALSAFTSGDNGYVTLSRTASQTLSAQGSTITLSAASTAPGLAAFR